MFVIKPLKNLDLVLELRQQLELSLKKSTAQFGAQLQMANYWDNCRHNRWQEPSQLVCKQIEQLQHFLQECKKDVLTKYWKKEEQRL